MQRFLRNRFFRMFLAVLACAIAVAVDLQTGNRPLGVIVGFSLLLLTAFLNRSDNTTLLLSLVLYGLVLLVVYAPQPSGVLIGAVGVLFRFSYASAGFVVQLEDSTTSIGQYLLRTVFDRLSKPQIIPNPGNRLITPVSQYDEAHRVRVKPFTVAAVLRRNQLIRFLPPGQFLTVRFEYVDYAINLRPIQRLVRIGNLVAADATTLDATLSLTYRVNIRAMRVPGAATLSPADIQGLRNLSGWVADPEAEIRNIAETAFRFYVGQQSRAVLMTSAFQQRLAETLFRDLSRILRPNGLVLEGASVVAIQPDSGFLQINDAREVDNIRNNMLFSQERARGIAWANAIRDISRAYQRASARMPEEALNRELIRRMFEEAAGNQNARTALLGELARLSATAEGRTKL